MREPVKRLNMKSLIICIAILAVVVTAEVVCSVTLQGKFEPGGGNLDGDRSKPAAGGDFAEYEELGIKIDPDAVFGMFNPDEETGTKNEYGQVAYRINDEPVFKSAAAKGNLQIENHADNQHLMKVVITLADNDEVIYESGFIPPNARIPTAKLNTKLEKGEYAAEVTIQAYEINEEQTYIGDISEKAEILLTISK